MIKKTKENRKINNCKGLWRDQASLLLCRFIEIVLICFAVFDGPFPEHTQSFFIWLRGLFKQEMVVFFLNGSTKYIYI